MTRPLSEAQVRGIWQTKPFAPRIAAVARGSFKRREPPVIRGTGYVVERSQSFAEGVLLAVNLGEDADTTGAVYGQLAGAFHGETAIPEHWRARLAHRELIVGFADRLFELSESLPLGDDGPTSGS